MKIAAGHESKHKVAMSKAGDTVDFEPIPTEWKNLRMRVGASVSSNKAQASGGSIQAQGIQARDRRE